MERLEIKEETINSKIIHEGKILTLMVDNVRLPSGRQSTRELVQHKGGVTIVAQPDPAKVVLVRQYRYAIKKALWELPAGTLHSNEDPLLASKRELKEETGYLASKWESLGIVYPLPGYSSEVLYFFKATDLEDGVPEPDPDENIEIKVLDLKQAWTMVKDGDIRDAKSISGISLVMF